MNETVCRQCQQEQVLYAKGMCRRCYNYELRTGRPRPRDMRSKKPFVCPQCGDERKKYAKGLCRRCYSYQFRHGISRPKGYGAIDMQALERMFMSGYSLSQVSAETGHDPRTIKKYLPRLSPDAQKQIAYRVGRGHPKITYAETMEVYRLRLGGMTVQAIADRFGVHKSTISRMCKQIDTFDPSALLVKEPEPALATL